jgi:formylglycine-generating enzyme
MKTASLFAILLAALVAISCADRVWGDTFGSGVNTFDIAFTTIGNPGNPADTTGGPNPAGAVSYVYNIGTFDISRDMITKANNVGNLTIPLPDMTSFGGNGVNRPATAISWNEAARFVNWLDTSTGSPPAYKFALQPGDSGYSANADIQIWTPSDAGYNPNNLYRNSLTHYFLPSVDEWYKAAYYDPTTNVYYDYPTGSNSAPTAVASGTAAGTAVYNQPVAQGPADITQAGGLSPYGTMGQGGNVYNWEETDYDLVNGPTPSSSPRGVRGGGWNDMASVLTSFDRFSTPPANAGSNFGFRVASTSTPEPSSLFLAAMASAGLLLRRRR